MSASIYQMISIAGLLLAAVFLVVAVILFFAFDIPALIGELSGKTAAKQVAEIREKNRKAVSKRQMMEHIGLPVVVEKQKEVSEETVLLNEETEQLSEETTLLSENKEEHIEDYFEIVQSLEELHTNIIV